MTMFGVKRTRAASSTGWNGRATKRPHWLADIPSGGDVRPSIGTEQPRTPSLEIGPQETLVKLDKLSQLVASQNELITQLSEAVLLLTLEVQGRTKNQCECPSYIT